MILISHRHLFHLMCHFLFDCQKHYYHSISLQFYGVFHNNKSWRQTSDSLLCNVIRDRHQQCCCSFVSIEKVLVNLNKKKLWKTAAFQFKSLSWSSVGYNPKQGQKLRVAIFSFEERSRNIYRIVSVISVWQWLQGWNQITFLFISQVRAHQRLQPSSSVFLSCWRALGRQRAVIGQHLYECRVSSKD